MKTKVLFVDDEPNVIYALKRIFKSMEKEWDIKYSLSGKEALSILNKEQMDVVVTDLRMPSMNGLELLKEIKKIYPEIIRIVLSGISEQDMILRAIEYSHQYLIKPCNPGLLKSIITKSYDLRNSIKKDEIIKIVSATTSIPSLPELYSKLLNELLSLDKSIGNISEIISNDIGMSAKMLKIINSEVFKLIHVCSIEDAVNKLGIDVIKTLVLSIDIFSRFDEVMVPDFNIERLLNHSLRCAKYAREIALAEKADKITLCNTYMAGMLHDVGILIIASNFKKEFRDILALIKDKNISYYKSEKEVLNVTHAEIGAYLMNLWGLPYDIIDAILFHQVPSKSPNHEFSPLTAIHTANCIYYDFYKYDMFKIGLDEEYLKNINCLNKINKWKDACLK